MMVPEGPAGPKGRDFMDEIRAAGVLAAVTEAGLAGAAEPDLLRLFCAGLNAEGVPVARAMVLIDTLHPVHEGHVFRWGREAELRPVTEYGRTSEGGATAEKWNRSPFRHLLDSGESMLRRRVGPEHPADFDVLEELRAEGQTDYLALFHRFPAGAVIGEMDGVYSSWVTDAPDGFTDGHIEALSRSVPSLALAVKSAALARIARTLVETYLGRDAGRRVLGGRITRGVAEKIGAVLWYSDLRGFTRITETAAGEVIPFLNDYADAVISSVHEAGGDVLKLIGDGTLAIFKDDDPGAACACALAAESLMRARVSDLNRERAARALPVTETYLGLHIGEVFYGNVGSRDRLDFTVVGPAVNEASRIVGLCRSVDRTILVSSAFAAAARAEDRTRLVSIGRYALKGVARAQELFTLERDADA
jgi:adenylate cyclase